MKRKMNCRCRHCRIVDLKKLLKCLKCGNAGMFREWYVETLGEKLKARKGESDNFWSKAVAVGDPDWLGKKAGECGLKRFRIVDSGQGHYLVGKHP